MSLEFTRYKDGTCALADGDELLWSSDGDDEFIEEFDAEIDSEDISDVLDWLEDAGYMDDSDAVDIVDESDEDTASVDDEPYHDDEDEGEGAWRH